MQPSGRSVRGHDTWETQLNRRAPRLSADPNCHCALPIELSNGHLDPA